jgi:hypothetical protein
MQCQQVVTETQYYQKHHVRPQTRRNFDVANLLQKCCKLKMLQIKSVVHLKCCKLKINVAFLLQVGFYKRGNTEFKSVEKFCT